jgi:hypothetical protein
MRPMNEMSGGCANYEWDMRNEFALIAADAEPAKTYSKGEPQAPNVPINKKLAVTLFPTSQVNFVVEPERRGKKAEEFAGLARLVVPKDGTYRVSTVIPLWVEIASGAGERVRSNKFEMQSKCEKIFKSAAFPLRAGTPYWLQLSASGERETFILITPEPIAANARAESRIILNGSCNLPSC